MKKTRFATLLPLLLAAAFSNGALAQKTGTTTDTMTWVRVNVTAISGDGSTPVITVPASSTKPYFLRQIYTSMAFNPNFPTGPVGYNFCDLYVGGVPVLPLNGTSAADMNVPFRAGEVVSVGCSPNYLNRITFVFSY